VGAGPQLDRVGPLAETRQVVRASRWTAVVSQRAAESPRGPVPTDDLMKQLCSRERAPKDPGGSLFFAIDTSNGFMCHSRHRPTVASIEGTPGLAKLSLGRKAWWDFWLLMQPSISDNIIR
jgi:hypothetical protein